MKSYKVAVRHRRVMTRVIDAETEADARKFVTDTIGLHDFALSAGAKASEDELILDSVTEVA